MGGGLEGDAGSQESVGSHRVDGSRTISSCARRSGERLIWFLCVALMLFSAARSCFRVAHLFKGTSLCAPAIRLSLGQEPYGIREQQRIGLQHSRRVQFLRTVNMRIPPFSVSELAG
jgi:hypothetical protein